MGTLNRILGNAGARHHLEHAGKVYEVKLIDQGVQAAFEKRLYERLVRGLAPLREALTAAEYAIRIQQLTDAYEAGELGMLSERGTKFMVTAEGIQLLLGLLIECEPAELFVLVVAKKTEIAALLKLVIRESFPGVEVEDAAPNP